jgi:hypothetical protein
MLNKIIKGWWNYFRQDNYYRRAKSKIRGKVMMKRRGRPRKKDKKTERFTVWVNSQAKEKLAAEAALLGIALSAYAGDRLSREREIYMARSDRARLLSLRFQLHKLSANLERIAQALECLAGSNKQIAPPRLGWLQEVSDEVARRLADLDQNLYELRPFHPGE